MKIIKNYQRLPDHMKKEILLRIRPVNIESILNIVKIETLFEESFSSETLIKNFWEQYYQRWYQDLSSSRSTREVLFQTFELGYYRLFDQILASLISENRLTDYQLRYLLNIAATKRDDSGLKYLNKFISLGARNYSWAIEIAAISGNLEIYWRLFKLLQETGDENSINLNVVMANALKNHNLSIFEEMYRLASKNGYPINYNLLISEGVKDLRNSSILDKLFQAADYNIADSNIGFTDGQKGYLSMPIDYNLVMAKSAQYGNLGMIEKMIGMMKEKRIYKNYRWAMAMAARGGQIEIFHKMIKLGADSYLWSLVNAAEKSTSIHVEIVKIILSLFSFKREDYEEGINSAARSDGPNACEIIDLILDQIPKCEIDYYYRINLNSIEPLRLEMVKKILTISQERKDCIAAINLNNLIKRALLQDCSYKRFNRNNLKIFEVIQEILKVGNQNNYQFDYLTIINEATSAGQIEVVKMCMEVVGSKFLTEGHWASIIRRAAYGGYLDIFKLARSHQTRESNNVALLSLSSIAGHTDIVRYLLEKYTKIDGSFSLKLSLLGNNFITYQLIDKYENQIEDTFTLEMGKLLEFFRNDNLNIFDNKITQLFDNITIDLGIIRGILRFGENYDLILEKAASYGDPKIINFIINQGARHFENSFGNALGKAIDYSQDRNFYLLLNRGVNDYDEVLSTLNIIGDLSKIKLILNIDN